MSEKPNPSTPSSAYVRMQDGWQTIDDILAGPATIRAAGTRYLPKYSAEDDQPGEYERRLSQTPWRPEFEDILSSLASKPFSKEIALLDGAPAAIKLLKEDIDARGNDLTAFCRPVFKRGIAKGMHAILVDFPSMAPGVTLADEKAAGARPYWVSIRAEDILALYTTFENGKEIVAHVRLREDSVERSGFGEVTTQRVRILEPGKWEVWRKVETAGKAAAKWVLEASGGMSLGVVPLALFWTGERQGAQFVRPPLESVAAMQLEIYRAMSRQDEVLTYAGSPMLCAQGIAAPGPQDPQVKVGPKRALFAPPGREGEKTGWAYIQPDAACLTEIREDVESRIEAIRHLGMQPMARRSGDYTATAASIDGAKAHSTVEAWAIGLKDVIEQALVFTGMWLNEKAFAEVDVCTDFSVEPYAQAPLDALEKARARRDITRETYWNGLRRFDVLPPDFDPEKEEEGLASEQEGLEPEVRNDPITGKAIEPALAA